MKKSILLSAFAFLGLNASIITLDNSNLNNTKTIYFSNNAKILTSPQTDKIIINNRKFDIKNTKYIVLRNNNIIAKLLKMKQKVVVTQDGKAIKTYPKLITYYIYGAISKIIYDNKNIDPDLKHFLVVDGKTIYYVSLKKEETSIYSIFKNKKIPAYKIYLKINKTIKISPKGYYFAKNPYKDLFELYVDDNSNILKLSLKNKNFDLEKVYNNSIETYKNKKSKLVTKITKEYDLSSPLTSIFVLKQDENQYRLKFKRGLNPKNRHIINSNLEASNKIFKPDAPLNLTYDFASLSFNIPKKALFELQGIFKEDGNVIYKFSNRPKNRYAVVIYKNNQNEPDKNEYYNSRKRYYTFSNIINLLEWMRHNKKSSQSIMMFFDNVKPVNYDISLNENSFTIKRGSKIAFNGKFNQYGYVKEISINNKKLLLEDLYSKTTYKNRQILENFKKSHHIIEIKDNK